MTNFSRFVSFGALLVGGLALAQTDYVFSDGGKRQSFRLSSTEVFARKAPGIDVVKSEPYGSDGAVYTVKAGVAKLRKDRKARASAAKAGGTLYPVFYDVQDLPAADKLAAMKEPERSQRMAGARRVMTQKLLVHMDESRFAALEAGTQAVSKEASLLKGWMLVSYPDPFTALDAADWMTRTGGWEYIPVFMRQMAKKQAALQREVNDPLFPKQGHLSATVEPNLNIKNAWDSVTGKGINIAVVDDGLEVNHEDLKPNAYPLESGYHRNFNEGPPNDPSPLKISETHGTACAGLAAAAGFNNLGVIGVAPEAQMMGLRLIAGNSTEEDNGTALAWQPDGLTVHVSSNSWGPPDDGKSGGRVSALQLAGIEKGATNNRGGLGTLYAVSCGNGRQNGDNASYDGFSGSRFAIAVAAVNRDGEQSSYSEDGMNVAISAFGGEQAPPAMMWTTNNSGDEVLAKKNTDFPTSEAPVNYTDAFNGTSAAAPQVSGGIALLLQQNPALGYRDVKEILMKTARRDILKGSDPFTPNTGGFQFSHSFGAGVMNVADALAMATGWTNLGPLISAEATAGGVPIPDTGELASVDLDLSNAGKIRVEHVEVMMNVKHGRRGDLAFGIQSPGGMLSEAKARPLDDAADFSDYMFTSVRHWGETSSGVWKFIVRDTNANGVAGELVNVSIKIYGTAAQ